MTKEITKAIILQEIEDKLKLREFEPGKFLFDERVVPTYDIGSHLVRPTRAEETVSVTSAGYVKFYMVPHNERWKLHRYGVTFMTGAYTVAGVFVGRPLAVDYVYLDLIAAQSTSYINDLPKDVMLHAGDGIYIDIDGYTSTGDLRLVIDVTVEEIR